MATTGKQKTFDAVRFMREAREKLSDEINAMSFEQQREHLELKAEKVRKTIAVLNSRKSAA